jgi:hypothetical protein
MVSFSGYRDAECGWIVVGEEEEEENTNETPAARRRALFAVIYAPKRGILEVTTFRIINLIRLHCIAREYM